MNRGLPTRPDRREIGTVQAVEDDDAGSELVVAAGVGAMTLTLADVTDFSEDGGQARIDPDGDADEVVTYQTVNDDLNTMQLAAGTTLAHGADELIRVEPEASDRYAWVALNDDEDDVIQALVPTDRRAELPEGIRAEDDREQVVCVLRNGDWRVRDVLGRPARSTSDQSATFTFPGNLSVSEAKPRYYADRSFEIRGVWASVDTAPAGADVLVQVKRVRLGVAENLFEDADRLRIVAGTFRARRARRRMRFTDFLYDDYFKIDVQQIGSTTPGASMVVQIFLRPV